MGCATSVLDKVTSKELDQSSLEVNGFVEEALQYVKVYNSQNAIQLFEVTARLFRTAEMET
jgi:hypothetical protein